MHFEILVEDQSGKVMLEALMPRLMGTVDTFEVHGYKGIGRIPKGLKTGSDPSKRILLDQLPKLLAGYGKTFSSYGETYPAVVIVVCDLDDRDRRTFARELKLVAERASPCPKHAFCFAIEEGEAWFLGDAPAVRAAYPRARPAVLSAYVNDSICGTWEVLANAIYPGGAKTLSDLGWQSVGLEKSRWAANITPKMRLDGNRSPSFQAFVTTIQQSATTPI